MSQDRPEMPEASAVRARYESEYNDWIRTMNPEQRRALNAMGVEQPDFADGMVFESKREVRLDARTDHYAGTACDPEPIEDSMEDGLAEQFGLTARQARGIADWHRGRMEEEQRQAKAFLLQRVVAGLIHPGNVRVRVGALAFATDLAALNGWRTQDEFAKSESVSRQAVSKLTKWWQRQLELMPSRFMKSEEACATYSEAAKKKHWRGKKMQPGAFLRLIGGNGDGGKR